MKMFINGIPCDASDGMTIDVINPATGAVVDTVPDPSVWDRAVPSAA